MILHGKKACHQCTKWKGLYAFHKSSLTEDGYSNFCTKCKKTLKLPTFEKPIVPEGYKQCSRCKQVLAFDRFSKDKTTPTGLASHCRVCRKAYFPTKEKPRPKKVQRRVEVRRLVKAFGVTEKQAKELIQKKRGPCTICKRTPKRSLDIDHSHTTGEIRGLLCGSCNVGLGMFKDNPELLQRAIEYLSGLYGKPY